MHHLPRCYVEKHWLLSICEKLDKIHYRETPPGTGHAECDPNAEYCGVHQDKVNPHQDPLGHLIEDSPETLVGLGGAALAGTIVYARRKDIGEAFLVALGVGAIIYIIAKFVKSLL